MTRTSLPAATLTDGARELDLDDAPPLAPAAPAALLCCVACGAQTEARCQCGADYVPRSELAAKAIAANPELSDRALAAKIKVAPNTIRRARATAQQGAVGKRTGRDGRTRKLPAKVVRKVTAAVRSALAVSEFSRACDALVPQMTVLGLDAAAEYFSRAYNKAIRR